MNVSWCKECDYYDPMLVGNCEAHHRPHWKEIGNKAGHCKKDCPDYKEKEDVSNYKKKQ